MCKLLVCHIFIFCKILKNYKVNTVEFYIEVIWFWVCMVCLFKETQTLTQEKPNSILYFVHNIIYCLIMQLYHWNISFNKNWFYQGSQLTTTITSSSSCLHIWCFHYDCKHLCLFNKLEHVWLLICNEKIVIFLEIMRLVTYG